MMVGRGVSQGTAIFMGLLASWFLLATGEASAADVETRDFQVLVNGKQSGMAYMTFNRQDDGTCIMTCDTEVKVNAIIFTYKYSYRGREVWKEGRLQRFDSTSNDNGKRYVLAAQVEGEQLRLRVNNQERLARSDCWVSTYWEQPTPQKNGQTVPVLDADTGVDLTVRIQQIGAEQRTIAGQLTPVQHYRLQAKNIIDIWYDPTGRIVRQEWLEDGHRTILEMVRVRR